MLLFPALIALCLLAALAYSGRAYAAWVVPGALLLAAWLASGPSPALFTLGRGALRGARRALRRSRPPAQGRDRARDADPVGRPAPARRDGEDRARGRHRVVGRRAFLREPRLGVAHRVRAPPALREGKGLPRKAGRRTLRHAGRLGSHAAGRSLARCLEVSEGEGVLRNDHSGAVRRARVLGPRAFGGRHEARQPERDRRRDRDGAQFAGAGGAVCSVTEPRIRRTTTCPGSRPARRCPASR